MSNLLSLTSSQLNQAAKLKDQISGLEKKLAALLGGSVATAKPAVKAAKKTISAAGLARIKAAQKARWAKINSSKPTTKPTKPAVKTAVKVAAKKKHTMSAEARARIAAAAKARWAKAKASGKNAL